MALDEIDMIFVVRQSFLTIHVLITKKTKKKKITLNKINNKIKNLNIFQISFDIPWLHVFEQCALSMFFSVSIFFHTFRMQIGDP